MIIIVYKTCRSTKKKSSSTIPPTITTNYHHTHTLGFILYTGSPQTGETARVVQFK